MDRSFIITPGEDDLDRRLDRIIRKALPDLTLGEVYKALRKGWITLDGRRSTPDHRLQQGESICIARSLASRLPAGPDSRPPLPGFPDEGAGVSGTPSLARRGRKREAPSGPGLSPGEILLEDPRFLVLNKKPGELVHGRDSLESRVRRHLEGRLAASLSFVPGPLHRLDRNTSGLLFFGRSLEGARLFSRLLREGRIEKYYLAVLSGRIRNPETWKDRLTREEGVSRVDREEGKEALTLCRPLLDGEDCTLALLQIRTGRTHQIRVQAAHRGHPLLGDGKYGRREEGRYLLHAWLLRLPPADAYPAGLCLPAPPPEPFLSRLRGLFPGADPSAILEKTAREILEAPF